MGTTVALIVAALGAERRRIQACAGAAARAERFKVTQAVGRHKRDAGLPPSDPQREERQIARLRELARSANLDPDFSEKFLRFIIDEVIRHHERVREAG